MRLTRLAAVAAAGLGLALFGAAGPAVADSQQPAFEGTISPNPFVAGDTLTVSTTGCPTVPTVEDQDGLFASPLTLAATGEGAHEGSAPTNTDLTAGATYAVVVTCAEVGNITFTTTPQEEEEPEPPQFAANISPNVFRAGDTLTLTTAGCPTVPTVEDVSGLFTGPLSLKPAGDNTHKGSATTKSNLVDGKVYKLVVTCEDVGKVTFTTKPGEKIQKDDGQTSVVPEGGVDTGDGSTVGGFPMVSTLAGAAAVAMAVAMVGFLARRRFAWQENA